MMRKFCAFDIYGTLFDMRSVFPTLKGMRNPEEFYRLWRFKLVHYIAITTAIGKFVDLPILREKTYDFCVQELEENADPKVKRDFLDSSLYLDPFSDTRPGLERLRAAGIKLVALSTGLKSDLEAMFKRAGLLGHFDHIITNKEAGIYKPHTRSYTYALERLGIQGSDMWMVASHPWDLIGARSAGLEPAWLRRAELAGLESRTYDTIDEEPKVVGSTFGEVVDQIIAAK